MERDKIIDKNLEKIQQDIIKDFGVELGLDSLARIADSQFKMAKFAMENRIPIKFNYLGQFRIKAGRQEAINSTNEMLAKGIEPDKAKLVLKAREIQFRNNRKKFTITRVTKD